MSFVDVLVLMVEFGLGFLFGYSLCRSRDNIATLREKNAERQMADELESAVADSSPQHLRDKREEHYRKGEPLENEDSQIVNIKTAAQRQSEAQAAKEKKLDKWMPGVKRG